MVWLALLVPTCTETDADSPCTSTKITRARFRQLSLAILKRIDWAYLDNSAMPLLSARFWCSARTLPDSHSASVLELIPI